MVETHLPVKLPAITLTHGQVIWLLVALGHRDGVAERTFYEYIKSLRKLGIPFGRRTLKSQNRILAEYHYCDVMELAVTLALRVYHVVPDSVLKEIIRNRARLRRFYRLAYEQRQLGQGAPVSFAAAKGAQIELHGRFLDLGIKFSGGRLLKFGPPRLLTPVAALALSVRRMRSVETSLPLGLSALAERVVAFASTAPPIRRRRPVSTRVGDEREGHGILQVPKTQRNFRSDPMAVYEPSARSRADIPNRRGLAGSRRRRGQ